MSLYNLLNGVNNNAFLLLKILGIDRNDIPRFRDCFLTEEGNICIYTRTGGGNRDYYESEEIHQENYGNEYDYTGPYNEDLRENPYFIRDKDEDYDCTYANFYFSIPDEFKEELKNMEASIPPSEKWQKLFESMEVKK